MDKYEPTFTSSDSSEGEEEPEKVLEPLEACEELLQCKSCSFPIPLEPEEVPGNKRKDSRKVSFAKGTKGKGKKGWQTYSGILLTLTCGLCYAIVGLIVKYLKEYNPLNLAFFRFAGMFVPSVPFVVYLVCVKKKSLFRHTDLPKWKICGALFGRSFVGFSAAVSHFFAIRYLTVADAMTIGSCTPVFVTLVAHMCLGEKCGVFPILAAVLTITGVGIISRPPVLTGAEQFDTDVLIGAALALGKMIFSSLTIVFLRYLRQVHVGLVLCASGFLSLLQNTTASLTLGVFDLTFHKDHVIYVGILWLASFLGHLCLVLALKCEEAGPFSILMSCDVIFAFVLQFVFLGIVPDVFSLVGATILVAAVCLTVLRKWVQSLPQDAQARKTLWIVLK